MKNKQIISVLTSDGLHFNTVKALIGHVKLNKNYTIDDVDRLKRFPDGQINPKVEKYLSAPKPVEGEKATHFTLKDYKKSLISNSAETVKIKSYLKSKGWKEDDVLVPKSWLFLQKPGLTQILFLTDAGDLLGSVKEANNYLKDKKMNFVIDGSKCKTLLSGDNHELQIKRMQKNSKAKENLVLPPNLPPNISITKVNKPKSAQNPVAQKFSLDFLDMERNKPIAGFKNMFHKLEIFKKSVVSAGDANDNSVKIVNNKDSIEIDCL